MNYRHAFHAGNFADVFKHLILTRLLIYLMRKPTPLRFIDTHAGIGLYDLTAAEAQRTGEWAEGVGRLWEADLPAELAEMMAPWLAIVRKLNPDGKLARYPGSPVLAAELLRPDDRMVFSELHPEDARHLRSTIGRDRRVKIVEIDAYAGLNAFLPPPERRGLVLIDPPFEKSDEFDALARAVTAAWTKWRTGVYAIWYPLKHPDRAARFGSTLVDAGVRRVLRIELEAAAFDPVGPLTGNGMIVINPTHGLADEVRAALPELAQRLAQGHPAWRIDELAGD